ncbi:MAG: GerMN domain-containing protein [Spirochaetales bacterium]|nr:GerMN domain-containing protein [Spirochaetales bacterium]
MIKKILPYTPVALMLVILITVTVLFNYEKGRNSYILFFPLDTMNGSNAEMRDVYRSSDKDRRLEIFINELILGPVSLKMNSFIPSGTKIRSFIWNDDVLYLDMNKEFIRDTASIPLDYEARISILKRNIQFNFPKIREISLTVEGQVPGSEYFGLSEE